MPSVPAESPPAGVARDRAQSADPAVAVELALLKQRLAQASLDVEALAKQRQEDTAKLRSLEDWRNGILGGIAVLIVTGGLVFWQQKRRLEAAGLDGLVDDVANKLTGSYQARLLRLWEAQLEDSRHRILARDRRVLLLGSRDPQDLAGSSELRTLERMLRAVGFTQFATSVEDAELVVVVGLAACREFADELAAELQGRLVPVVFYCGPNRLDPDPTPRFEYAVPANTRATALLHLSNLALLLRQAPVTGEAEAERPAAPSI